MQNQRLLLIFFFFSVGLLIPFRSLGTHVIGGNLTYACQGGCVYEIAQRTYYECGATATPLPPLPPPNPLISLVGQGTNCAAPNATGNWQLQSYVEVTPICATLVSDCSNSGSMIYGTLEATYTRTYDFCVPGACSSYVASWNTCCRSTVLTSGAANDEIYVESQIDLSVSPCNNSPVFLQPLPTTICANSGTRISQLAHDPDGDSLVYQLTACREGGSQFVNYTTGFTPQAPLGPNWQVSLDPVTAELSILPAPGGQVAGVVCVEVSEYRNGIFLGTTTRDQQVIAVNCTGSNALPQADTARVLSGGHPGNSSPWTFEMCATDTLRLAIGLSDPDAGQSLSATAFSALPGVSGQVTGSNPAQLQLAISPGQKGSFDIPLEVSDSYCPFPGKSVQLLRIEADGLCIKAVQDSLQNAALRAKVWSDGSLFWDPNGGGGLEVPRDSGLSVAKAAGLWISGRDANGNLHLAVHSAENLQRGLSDFWAGPLTNGPATTDSATVAGYNRFWRISRTELDAYLQDWGDNGVIDTPANYPNVYSWPAFGQDAGGNNISATGPNGQTVYLAPFVDVNGNPGDYDPGQGDHPLMEGDEMLWWIYNDGAGRHGSGGIPLGMEIHASAFLFDCPDSLQKNQSLFLEYTLINRSNQTYTEMQVGFWTDGELGEGTDDYTGFDSLRNLYYFYNGDADDQGAYGLNPPAFGLGLLNGPLADANDGVDNDRDGMIDEVGETLSLSGFLAYDDRFPSLNGTPSQPSHYDNYLRSFWKDSQPLVNNYSTGSGSGIPSQGTGPRSLSMLPGDVCLGTGWTAENAAFPPADQRALGSMGPFTLAPGGVRRLAVHYSWERAFYQDEIGSVCELLDRADEMGQFYQSGYASCGSYDPPVHPGDANFDQVANNLDVLAIGINYGTAGPIRLQASNLWVPQNALPWGDTLANGADLKHSDCDGNGLIDTFDLAPILLNYGNTHTYTKTSAVGAPLFMTPPARTFLGGDTARIPVHWGDMNDPVQNAYGLAFSLTYDSSLVAEAWIEFSTSWFASPGTDLLALGKDRPNDERIEVGMSRNDMTDRMGYGHICDLIVVMDDDLNKRIVPMTLDFEGVYAIDEVENEIPVATRSATLNLETALSPPLQAQLSLFPNPTADDLVLDGVPEREEVLLRLLDMQGKEMPLEWKGQGRQLKLSLGEIPDGFYLLQVRAGAQRAILKVIKQQ